MGVDRNAAFERCDGRHTGGDCCTSEIGHEGACTFGGWITPKRANRPAARISERAWNRAYDEAMQWRDWQECDRLSELRESQPWFAPSYPLRFRIADSLRWNLGDFVGRWISARLGAWIEGSNANV